MKKCVVKVTHNSTGEVRYSFSCGDNNTSYKLTSDITQAQKWYGKHMEKGAQERINADKKQWYNFGNSYEIVYIEEEPHWYFELWYALRRGFGDSEYNEVRKGFPLDPNIQYKIRKEWGKTRPLINDLPLEELQRYYKWRKEHYRGKPKAI